MDMCRSTKYSNRFNSIRLTFEYIFTIFILMCEWMPTGIVRKTGRGILLCIGTSYVFKITHLSITLNYKTSGNEALMFYEVPICPISDLPTCQQRVKWNKPIF